MPGLTSTADRLRQIRDGVLRNRAISVPTLMVQRFFSIDGLRAAMLMAFNLFICVVPLTIILFAWLSFGKANMTLGDVMVRHFRLTDEAARLVSHLVPTNQRILKVASVITVLSFAISGFDVANAFQKMFASAWRVKPIQGWRGSARGGVWFVLVFLVFLASQMLNIVPTRVGWIGYILIVPIVAVLQFGLWLVTPRLVLDRDLDFPDLKPGAIFGMIGGTLLWGSMYFVLPSWFDWYGRGFGGIGIALAMLSWTYVVTIVWVVIVVAGAAYWERTATVEEVLELVGAGDPALGEGTPATS